MLAKIDSGCVGFKYIIMKRNKGMGRNLRQKIQCDVQESSSVHVGSK